MATKNLYRGKSAIDGQMVYGSLLITEIGGKDIYWIIPRASFTEFVNKLVSPRYNVWTKSGAANNYYIIQVDPETVGQYTGLKDKNSEMIFEGDIIKRGEYIYRVKYNTKLAAFTICGDAEMVMGFLKRQLNFYEKIGNIHDNPDLLKVEVADD